MKRRKLAVVAARLALLAAMPVPTLAQEEPVELQDYVRLAKDLPPDLPPGKKIELVEFFWYECPHCNAFEPILRTWVAGLDPDVEFRQVPVGFSPRHEVTQRLYYALQALGRIDGEGGLHLQVYEAIHNRWRAPSSERQWADFVAGHGVDRARFVELFRSSTVSELLRKANQWADAAEVEGVPTLLVQGRYTTSPARAGTRERSLFVAGHLMRLARQAL